MYPSIVLDLLLWVCPCCSAPSSHASNTFSLSTFAIILFSSEMGAYASTVLVRISTSKPCNAPPLLLSVAISTAAPLRIIGLEMTSRVSLN